MGDAGFALEHPQGTGEGRGVGGALARHALDEVAGDESLRVVPRCPFIKAWIARHPDYAALVRPAPWGAGR